MSSAGSVEGWSTVRLGTVCDVLSGSTPSTAEPAFWDGDIPWITPKDLRHLDGGTVSSGSRSISELGYAGCSTVWIPAGSVVMSSRAPVGYLAVTANPITTNQGCKSFVPRHSIDPEFLLFALRYHMPEIIQQGSGTTFVEVSKKTLENFEIDVPELSEQRRIVGLLKEALADVREAKEALERVPKQMKQFRQAVLAQAFRGELTADWREANADRFREAAEWFDKQFGKPDPTQPSPILTADQLATIPDEIREWLPGDRLISCMPSPDARKVTSATSTATATATTEDDDLPTVWSRTTFRAVARVATGATPLTQNRTYYDAGTVPWATSGDVNNPMITEVQGRITEKAIAETNCKVFPAGTLLIAMYGEGQTRGRVAELAIAAATNQACAALLFNGANEVLRPWLKLFQVFNYELSRREATGGVQPNLNLSIIKSTRLPLPAIAEQAEILRQIEGVFAEAAATEAAAVTALANLRRLEQSTLQAAFRGEL